MAWATTLTCCHGFGYRQPVEFFEAFLDGAGAGLVEGDDRFVRVILSPQIAGGKPDEILAEQVIDRDAKMGFIFGLEALDDADGDLRRALPAGSAGAAFHRRVGGNIDAELVAGGGTDDLQITKGQYRASECPRRRKLRLLYRSALWCAFRS